MAFNRSKGKKKNENMYTLSQHSAYERMTLPLRINHSGLSAGNLPFQWIPLAFPQDRISLHGDVSTIIGITCRKEQDARPIGSVKNTVEFSELAR
jgi:hypothetical protein